MFRFRRRADQAPRPRRRRSRWRRLLAGPWLLSELIALFILWAPLPAGSPDWAEPLRLAVGATMFIIVLGMGLYNTLFMPEAHPHH